MGKDGEQPQQAGQQQPGPQNQGQQQGQKTAPGAAAAGNGATGGAKHKEAKVQPPPPAHPPPVQVLQLTPELFQQTVAAAVTAALTATTRQTTGTPPGAAAAAAAVASPDAQGTVLPRKEKKLADFCVSRPTMWFRLFHGQFPEALTEDVKFNALLNHLPSQALPFVDHILRDPGQDPFARAKACLIKHYEVSPRDRARTLRSLTSLGERTPSEMLYYMRSLQPGFPDSPLFEAIFLDLLPANARDAAVKYDRMEEMAEAADRVLAEAPATSTVSHVSEDLDVSLSQVARSPASQSTAKKFRDASLCYNHGRYGRGAFKCGSPKTCRMRDIISKPPQSPASGNAKAGRH